MAAREFNKERVNYYSIAYGYLTQNRKDTNNRKVEIQEDVLKAKVKKYEKIDLRDMYIPKADGKYTVFYQSIHGVLKNIYDKQTDNGKMLCIEILDSDLEKSIIQTKLYGKYAIDILNRICNIKNIKNEVALTPYSIASSKDGREYYNSGVVIYEEGKKTTRKYSKDELPPIEETIVMGNKIFDKTKMGDFLLNEAKKLVNIITEPINNESIEKINEDETDLPF